MASLNAKPADDSVVEGPVASTEPANLRRILTWLLLANSAMYLIYGGIGGVLNPLLVERAVGAADKVSALGIVYGVSAIFATLANPIAGAFSDRVGRRNPFILGGAVLAAVVLAILGSVHTLLLVALFWSLGQMFMNVLQAAITAMVPDRVPTERLGTASAVVGLGLPVGGLVGAIVAGILSTSLGIAYLTFAVIIAFFGVLFTWRVKDVPLNRKSATPGVRAQIAAFTDALRVADFRWAFIGRALLVLGFFSVYGYQLYILQDRVDLPSGISPAGGTSILSVISTLTMGIAVAAGGTLSDRLGRRKIFVAVSGTIAGLAVLIPLLFTSWLAMIVFTLVNGLAFGCFMAVDTAVVATVLPSKGDAARDMGVLNVANAGPQIIAPFLASLLIAHLGGYDTLFVYSGIVTVVGAISVYRIRSVR
ncbi:MFS transporter [Cryptosporangium aurantiacum]|uniref:Major Facilitator Superfamily protein n=1 Tax=Cryptosporangium aurantiacum TaxID=134849 RepID=A0A1M7PP30_9ACTN|nr:MFS transporter [Cryptosporangium aurantiacum]SHN19078.1 Major Facilitator Superfamily protein [Cryptosporangium aurantiacum]